MLDIIRPVIKYYYYYYDIDRWYSIYDLKKIPIRYNNNIFTYCMVYFFRISLFAEIKWLYFTYCLV